MADASMAGAGLSVLFVCTGNVCRSPVAERLFRARVGDPTIDGRSAGTAALVGHGIDSGSAAALARLGGDPAGHIARNLTDDLVAAADVVLTAEVAHRGNVLGRWPGGLRRTFTLAELARLARAGPAPTGRNPLDRIEELALRRGQVPPPAPGEDDISDPYGAAESTADACAARIADAVDVLVAVLRGDDLPRTLAP